MDKELNPINQGAPFIGNDGKPYSSVEELTRANMIHENRQYAESILPNEPKLIDIDSVVFPKGVIKTDNKVVGYTMDVNDAQKMHIMDVIIDDQNYPLETLPEDVREMVILARQSKESKHEEITTKKR